MWGKKTRLSAVALGVAGGVMCGGWMLIVGLMATYGSFGTDMVTHWATMFPGIDASVKGSLVAGGWGFLKGFFSGLILAWLYNLCLCCCTRNCACPCCKSSCDTSSDVEKK